MGKRTNPKSEELMVFANAVRECLGLDPLPFTVTPKKGATREDHRFYQTPFAWPDAKP